MKHLNLFKLAALIAICLAFGAKANAQEDLPQEAIGIFGHINFNAHHTEIATFPDCPTCSPFFKDGNGVGFSIGALYTMPIYKQWFLDLRLGYHNLRGEMTTDENKVVNVDGAAVDGVFTHTLTGKISTISLEPIVGYRIWKGLNLHLGLNLGLLAQKSFEHKEEISQPSAGTYENGSRERLVASGDLQNTNSFFGALVFGASYDFPLDAARRWHLAPEAFYKLGFTDIYKDIKWKINTLSLGLAMRYTFEAPPAAKAEKPTDTKLELAEERILPADIRAVGITQDDNQVEVVGFTCEEFLSNRLHPLLPYVFFDDNSSEIPSRYNSLSSDRTASFSYENAHVKSSIDLYYDLLNIVGKRMRAYPDAKITIDGCNSNLGKEKDNTSLSKNRAEVVKNYLVGVWGIAPERITVRSRSLPQEPSDNREREGIEENRRAEISSDTWEIIAPIHTSDTVHLMNPPVMRFFPEAKSKAGMANWTITAYQNSFPIMKFSSVGEVPSDVDWRFERDEVTVPKNSNTMEYQLTAIDKKNQKYASEIKSIPVVQVTLQKKLRERTADKYIDRYSLMLFNFDKSDLSPNNQRVIEKIKSKLSPKSVIRVSGHTDRTGSAEYDRKLSLERAQSASKSFSDYKVTTKGFGKQELLYDNDLPEGRFYCRKVDIVVETPIE